MSYFYLIFSVIILSQAPNLVKLSTAPSLVMVFWRLFLASIVLGIVGQLKNQLKDLKTLKKNDWIIILITCFILFLHFILWFIGVRKTSIANSAIIFATNPIFTAIGGYLFFKEKFNRRYLIAMVLGMLGIFITFYDNLKLSHDAFFGDIFVLIGTVLFSAYILLSKKSRGKIHNIPYTYGLNLITSWMALLTIILLKIFGNFDQSLFNYDFKNWLSFILMAIFPSVLGHALFTHCLQFLNVNLMSTTMLLNPMLSAFVAFFLYDEHLKNKTIIGFLITSIGVFQLYYPGLKKFAHSFSTKRVKQNAADIN